MPTHVPTQAWIERVRLAQQAKTSPEQLERVREQAEAVRRRSEAQKRCRRLSTSQHLSSAAWRSASHSVSLAEISPMPHISTVIAARGTSAMRSLTDTFTSPVPRLSRVRSRSAAAADDDSDSEDQRADETLLSRGLAQHADLLVAEGSVPAAYRDMLVVGEEDERNGRAEAAFEAGLAQAQAAEHSELQQVLRQLEAEPSSEAARAVKFELYEQFAATVSNSRGATLALWDEVKVEFDGATTVQRAIERDLKAIDHERNLGIQDHSRVWFVHSMTSQAVRNAQLLDAALSGIRTKLGLLTAQHECPVCFESFDEPAGRPATTLGCAHKVCTECWGEWQKMRGAHAFCPLCRHDDFLNAVLTPA